MMLSDLKKEVDAAIDAAIEYGELPDKIVISLQIDHISAGSVWAKENIKVHYDNNGNASGCVLVGFPMEMDYSKIMR